MRNPDSLSLDEIENIEKLSLRALFTAARDFGFDAWDIFSQSNDDPKDVAEDATREMLDRFGGFGISQRIFGNVDYRKARYVVLPDYSVRQALFVDSKAEKASSTATLQMSQLSMRVRQHRGGKNVDIPGKIKVYEMYEGQPFLATILLAHYHYEANSDGSGRDRPPYKVEKLTLAAIPNGRLQERYNPDASNSIWLAGRNAPTLGEEFRVRLSFRALQEKASWRIQVINYDAAKRKSYAKWSD